MLGYEIGHQICCHGDICRNDVLNTQDMVENSHSRKSGFLPYPHSCVVHIRT